MKNRKEIAILVILVVLLAGMGILNPVSLHAENLENTGRLIGIYGIFSIGMGMVIITGGIDLSVGSAFALLGVILSIALMEWHWPPVLAALGVIVLASLLGWGNGLLVTRAKLQPFVVTLCGLLFYRGLARYISKDETKGFGTGEGFQWMKTMANESVLGVPIPLIILAICAVVMFFVLHRSVYGRHLYAVGRNEEAARYAGINSRGVIASSYVICGFFVGISTILLAFYTNSISPSSHGNFYELYAIAAAVLGGCSLRGGEGSIAGILLGTALLQVLRNMINMLDKWIPTSLEFSVMGIVILVGVLADSLLRKQRT
jgi:ribose transport system permease protein